VNAGLRVLVVDDHAVVRRGVIAYLEVLDDVEVAGEAADGAAALDVLTDLAVHGRTPDVVLMDLQMPGMDGVAAIAEIGRRFPSVRVVVLTSFGEIERVHAALHVGAAGYLLKDAGPGEIVAALHAAARGEVFLDAAVARRSGRRAAGCAPSPRGSGRSCASSRRAGPTRRSPPCW
jgi:DNA-binding NarL/FixJ family response regulator